jgi:hypothetical protein
VPASAVAQVEALYRERYAGFTAKHFHEHLVRDHSFRWGYTWTKVFLQSTGLLERPAAGCSSAQAAAPSAAGMMLRQDASKHEWCAGSPSVTSW